MGSPTIGTEWLILSNPRDKDVLDVRVGQIRLTYSRAADGAVGLELRDDRGGPAGAASVLIPAALAAYIGAWLSHPYLASNLLTRIKEGSR